MMDRRGFFKRVLVWVGGVSLGAFALKKMLRLRFVEESTTGRMGSLTPEHKPVVSRIYVAKNGTPEQNVAKVVEMMGGIERLVGKDDIVVIKPNGQWRRHGNTNTDTIRGFVDLILNTKSFSGEIIVAENHHDDPDDGRGWTTALRNGVFNLNELVAHYHKMGYRNVTKYHWRDGGPNPNYLQFRAGDGGIVSGPEEGDGYVWTDEEYVYGGRRVKMTYPVFTSSYSGTTVDFKHGAWKNGRYTDQPVKFINFAVLNHHGTTFGVTASVKNHLGVVDMSCGEHGPTPPGYYNFHYISIGWSKDHWLGRFAENTSRTKLVRSSRLLTKGIRRIGPTHPEALGGAVGHFMKTVRMADLHILAAEYVGPEGRTIKPVHTRTVLASKDPVSLDYYGGKYVLCPLGGSKVDYNDPDNLDGPFRRYLEECQAQGAGTLEEERMVIRTFDFAHSVV